MPYDTELPNGFQDADFEQRELEAAGQEINRLRSRGVCSHGHTLGFKKPAFYYAQEHMIEGERLCYACGAITTDDGHTWSRQLTHRFD